MAVTPYHAYVPSFGDWGFVMANVRPLDQAGALPGGLAFYSTDLWPAMVVFAADSSRVAAERNSIRDHALVRYYEQGWAEWMN